MSAELVERVARAIDEHSLEPVGDWREWIPEAQAAIEATGIESLTRENERLRAEAETFERAFRISLWNRLRGSGVEQDVAIQEIERAVKQVRTKALNPIPEKGCE
jgi:hypothetical protein